MNTSRICPQRKYLQVSFEVLYSITKLIVKVTKQNLEDGLNIELVLPVFILVYFTKVQNLTYYTYPIQEIVLYINNGIVPQTLVYYSYLFLTPTCSHQLTNEKKKRNH